MREETVSALWRFVEAEGLNRLLPCSVCCETAR